MDYNTPKYYLGKHGVFWWEFLTGLVWPHHPLLNSDWGAWFTENPGSPRPVTMATQRPLPGPRRPAGRRRTHVLCIASSAPAPRSAAPSRRRPWPWWIYRRRRTSALCGVTTQHFWAELPMPSVGRGRSTTDVAGKLPGTEPQALVFLSYSNCSLSRLALERAWSRFLKKYLATCHILLCFLSPSIAFEW